MVNWEGKACVLNIKIAIINPTTIECFIISVANLPLFYVEFRKFEIEIVSILYTYFYVFAIFLLNDFVYFESMDTDQSIVSTYGGWYWLGFFYLKDTDLKDPHRFKKQL